LMGLPTKLNPQGLGSCVVVLIVGVELGFGVGCLVYGEWCMFYGSWCKVGVEG
jgi:hypothetical protein